jgi:hypothetical protein
MVVLTYTFAKPINHPTHFLSSFSHRCKIHTLFHLFDKTNKMEKKEKENPFQGNMSMSAWKNIGWTKAQIWSMINLFFSSPLPHTK